ncbi:MAG: translation initiation factor IF-3 [Proteobacteria bacterium CG1_02_64_396]|nr:MAG: translation initiation factor IF-3 [Proteobacteria bacterium CG1_02_64_396]
MRVIADDGEQLGVLTPREALAIAQERGLDLVEVAAQADPPVCRLMDFGRFKYEQAKKMNEARKRQKIIQVKEIKLRPKTDEHDYQVKLRSALRFLEDGDKVKFTLRFRGREMAHVELGAKVLQRIEADLLEIGVVEQHPKMEGRQLVMVMAARAKK